MSQAMSALHLEIPLVSLCLGWFPFTLLGKWSNLEQIFWDGWFNHHMKQVQPPIQKIWNESYCWCFQKFDCTRYDIVILKWRPDFSKSERFWNLQSWWCFFFWPFENISWLSTYLSYPFLRLELPTATLRVPVMLVLCAMSSNQATLSFSLHPTKIQAFHRWIWRFNLTLWRSSLGDGILECCRLICFWKSWEDRMTSEIRWSLNFTI